MLWYSLFTVQHAQFVIRSFIRLAEQLAPLQPETPQVWTDPTREDKHQNLSAQKLLTCKKLHFMLRCSFDSWILIF